MEEELHEVQNNISGRCRSSKSKLMVYGLAAVPIFFWLMINLVAVPVLNAVFFF